MGFSRADWITVAVTLILFGLAYYLSGAKAAFICLVAGSTILVVMLFFKRKKPPPDPPSQSSQQTANPTVTQTANPTVNVNIGNQQGPHKATASASPAQKLKPNIRFVGVNNVEGWMSGDTVYGIPVGKARVFQTTLLCFRNEASKGVTPKQPSVNAHIVYKDSQGNEITDLNHGVWVQEDNDYTNFTTGDKKCLVVLGWDEQTGTLRKLWKEEYHTRDSWMAGGPLFRIRDEEVPGEIETVAIQLLDKWNGSCIDEFTLRVTDRPAKGLPVFTCVGELTSRGSSGS